MISLFVLLLNLILSIKIIKFLGFLVFHFFMFLFLFFCVLVWIAFRIRVWATWVRFPFLVLIVYFLFWLQFLGCAVVRNLLLMNKLLVVGVIDEFLLWLNWIVWGYWWIKVDSKKLLVKILNLWLLIDSIKILLIWLSLRMVKLEWWLLKGMVRGCFLFVCLSLFSRRERKYTLIEGS